MQLSEEMMMMILTSFLLQALSGDTSGENVFLLLSSKLTFTCLVSVLDFYADPFIFIYSYM